VKDYRIQDRHTFASRLVQAGISTKVAQELLGHANVATTMRYAHLAPADLRRAVDIVALPEEKAAEALKTPKLKDEE
jgi:integrase